MQMPSDTSLPFFSYGIFRVGGIGFIDCDLATEPIFEEKNKRRKRQKLKF